MTIRTLMIGVFAFVVGAILSILVVQYVSPNENDKSTTPPDPLTVNPDTAVEQTK